MRNGEWRIFTTEGTELHRGLCEGETQMNANYHKFLILC